ncbi:MAG TPA: beta-galactosidase GalA [Candidatus Dormibacteraeota bacterium]|nr:beta-galactosidase GalA [Candidatus Dormibacteraeota bacterium]
MAARFVCFRRAAFSAWCATVVISQVSATASPREHLSLDANWKFHLGDDWPNALHLDKAGASTGPASAKFSDLSWRSINLPHDWAVELPFDSSADGSHGFKALGAGFPKNSIGWYRRVFELPKEDEGKRIWLTFDGVFRDATVWVNGWLMRRHEGGYHHFREDITDVVQLGGRNIIAVRVDATRTEGWFYEGAGIYRHVWLDKTAPIAIAPDGVFVRSRFKDNVPAETAAIEVETSLLNTLTNAATAVVTCEIFSPAGKSLTRLTGSRRVPPESRETLELEAKLSSPVLWSPESPNVYKLVTSVAVGGKIIDQKETTFGVRTVGFDPANGFLLNGKHYELYGTCNHQDHAGVGTALPDALQEFRVKKLKEFGCNAIRTSHNPPTPELLGVCDRLGMLIMDESRLLGSDSENLRKWDAQIRRDRNHPCVAIWSVANEEFSVQDSAQGGNVARTMQNYVKRLDPTRPVTYAAPEGDVFSGINSVIEARGWNYHPGPDVDTYHAKHPEQSNVGTEQGSTVSTRGIYENDQARGYVSAYGNKTSWSNLPEEWWSCFAERPWLSGGFVWTGFDYRGEPTPYSWPCVNSHFGILDTCGFWKDIAWYYQAWWTTNTVLHLLPHWNWPGKEGRDIRVDAFSNCKSVELVLNGKSLGKQSVTVNSRLTWQVKYEPGTLSAKGFDDTGKMISETKVETTGDPVQIQLTPDRRIIQADSEDLSVFTVAAVDRQGRTVPVAQNKVNFSIEGAGQIIGVGNGDASSHEPDVYIANIPAHTIAVGNWRWKLARISKADCLPEYATNFDDSAWTTLKPRTDGDSGEFVIKTQNTTAIYRAHFTLSEEDLKKPGVQIRFAGCDDEGFYFVNEQFVGESHDWQAQPSFEIKKWVRAGDNVIAVGVKNVAGEGGLNPDVNVDVIGVPERTPWSRSLFNGLAQVIVQSTREPGEFKLTASAAGLGSATAIVQTQPCASRPSVP